MQGPRLSNYFLPFFFFFIFFAMTSILELGVGTRQVRNLSLAERVPSDLPYRAKTVAHAAS